jgi:hypothetical protein
MTGKLNSLAFSVSAAIVSALSMLILGILGNIGVYKGAVEMMTQWHMFFSLTPFGIFTGIIEAAVICFVFFYIFGWLYNKFTNLRESIEGGQ